MTLKFVEIITFLLHNLSTAIRFLHSLLILLHYQNFSDITNRTRNHEEFYPKKDDAFPFSHTFLATRRNNGFVHEDALLITLVGLYARNRGEKDSSHREAKSYVSVSVNLCGLTQVVFAAKSADYRASCNCQPILRVEPVGSGWNCLASSLIVPGCYKAIG